MFNIFGCMLSVISFEFRFSMVLHLHVIVDKNTLFHIAVVMETKKHVEPGQRNMHVYKFKYRPLFHLFVP